jgi:hypothetical protein
MYTCGKYQKEGPNALYSKPFLFLYFSKRYSSDIQFGLKKKQILVFFSPAKLDPRSLNDEKQLNSKLLPHNDVWS